MHRKLFLGISLVPHLDFLHIKANFVLQYLPKTTQNTICTFILASQTDIPTKHISSVKTNSCPKIKLYQLNLKNTLSENMLVNNH